MRLSPPYGRAKTNSGRKRMANDVDIRLDIEDLFAVKCELMSRLDQLHRIDKSIRDVFDKINGFSPIRLQVQYGTHAQDAGEKYIDQACWHYLVNLAHLERYMLCSDYDRMQQEINGFRAPLFNVPNAQAWMAGLRDLIYDNVRTLVRGVFLKITQGTLSNRFFLECS
jgi:hypothetical protein